MSKPRTRRLTFEPLEAKCSPTTLLLFCAPLDEPDQAVFESQFQCRSQEHAASDTQARRASAAVIPTARLLQFIAEQTQPAARDPSDVPRPSARQAAAADLMMRATDTELRSLIVDGADAWI